MFIAQMAEFHLEPFLPYMSMTHILLNASRGEVRKQAEALMQMQLAVVSHARPIAERFGKR